MRKILLIIILALLCQNITAQDGHRGLNADLGYLLATRSENADAQFVTLSVGKWLNNYLFTGTGSGIEIGGIFKSGKSPETIVPTFADVRDYQLLECTTFTPLL